MDIQFECNEFTTHELMQYIKAAFGKQINGAPFGPTNLSNWLRMKKIPEAYGAHRITSIKAITGISNVRILTVEGLTRDVLEHLDLLANGSTGPLPRMKRPRKQRTPFYYQVLEAAGQQYTRKTKVTATLPPSWNAIGIKQAQLAKARNRRNAIAGQ